MKKKINEENLKKMKKDKFIIPIHSFVDVITNSSTELFIIDKEKGLDMVKKIVEEGLKKFPGAYGTNNNKLHVYLDNPEYYDDSVLDGMCSDDLEKIIFELKKRGYKIKAPKIPQEPKAIIISWERGYMSGEFISFIETTFNVKLINN